MRSAKAAYFPGIIVAIYFSYRKPRENNLDYQINIHAVSTNSFTSHFILLILKAIVQFWLMVIVHMFWEGHKLLWNLHCRFDRYYLGQIYAGYFAKFCGLLRIYELYDIFLTLTKKVVLVVHCEKKHSYFYCTLNLY